MSALEVICQRKDFMIHLRDHPGDWTPVVADWLLHLLTKGLGKRVEMLCYKPQELCQVISIMWLVFYNVTRSLICDSNSIVAL